MRERIEYLLARSSDPDSDIDQLDVIAMALVEKAKDGNLRAIELLRDTIGQKPKERDNSTLTGQVVVCWQGQTIDTPAQAIDTTPQAIPQGT